MVINMAPIVRRTTGTLCWIAVILTLVLLHLVLYDLPKIDFNTNPGAVYLWRPRQWQTLDHGRSLSSYRCIFFKTVLLLYLVSNFISLLLMGFKLMAGAVASCALIGVAVGVGIIYGSLLISIGRNPSQRDELLRYAFIGFSLVEVSGLIGLVISLLLLFGFDGLYLT